MYEFTLIKGKEKRVDIEYECAKKEFDILSDSDVVDTLVLGCSGWGSLDDDDLLEQWKELCCKTDEDIQQLVSDGYLVKEFETITDGDKSYLKIKE